MTTNTRKKHYSPLTDLSVTFFFRPNNRCRRQVAVRSDARATKAQCPIADVDQYTAFVSVRVYKRVGSRMIT